MAYDPKKVFVSGLICQTLLNEADGVNSAIRIVDVFYVPEAPAELQEGLVPLVEAYAYITVKAVAGYHQEHYIEVSLLNTIGERSPLLGGDRLKADFTSRLGDEVPGGTTIGVALKLGVKRFGTCWVCVAIDGEECLRLPLTLLPFSAQKTENQ